MFYAIPEETLDSSSVASIDARDHLSQLAHFSDCWTPGLKPLIEVKETKT